MRSAAQLTHGRYLFLTDDSGIGNSHKEPTLPCFYVTTFTDAIHRSVDTELTGEHLPVSAEQLIRQSGDITTDGYCASTGENDRAMPF